MKIKVEAGKIAGIPIAFHFTYICLLILWGRHGLTSGSLPYVISTLIILAGLTGSILLHELGHAFAGRLFGMRADHIELHGMGGTCYYASGRPRDMAQDLTLSLAGPLANLLIYAVCQGIKSNLYGFMPEDGDNESLQLLLHVVVAIGSANFSMFWFNLLPAHPLDGGKIATILLAQRYDGMRAQVAVAWCGIAVAALLVASCRGSGFCAALALILAFDNVQVLMVAGQPPWKRWN